MRDWWDYIVRFLTIKIDEINDTPSPMMNGKSERYRPENNEMNAVPVVNNNTN